MNIDGSRVLPATISEEDIKNNMRVYEDNPTSKDILAYLFGFTDQGNQLPIQRLI